MSVRHCLLKLHVALMGLALTTMSSGADNDVTTIAEQSGYQRTGRYEEVERLCTAFQQRWPQHVRCIEFGRTPEGRPMLALTAAIEGPLDAATTRRKGRAVVLIQGGIHAGEIDGKDAGFRALRELLTSTAMANPLRTVTWVFVPVFNVDGHERFGRWNRPNQRGPEEMGWRTTGQNFNLNRDYTKAETAEMQALLRLLNEWDPIVYADLHVTDGADFEHDISVMTMPTLAGDEELVTLGTRFSTDLLQRLAAAGSLPLSFYPALVVEDDPTSGFAVSVPPARFSNAYWARRNRFGVLVETHSWKDYPTRVRITRNAIVAMLELAARHGQRWLAAARAADERNKGLGGASVALTYTNTDHVVTIDFRGVAYTRELSEISGALMTRYDSKRPQLWQIPLRDQVRPDVVVRAPRAGYVIAPAHAEWMQQKLALHGIDSRRLSQLRANSTVETFRAIEAKPGTATYEGRTTLSVVGEWRTEQREIPAGSLFVPISQPKATLLMTLLEPNDPDSFLSWGFFNNAFERKEYMEAYVAEQVARDMLARDPKLRQEFERKLAEDAEFARDPAARLEFFYRRHPSWDERLNLYPVYRLDSPP